MNSTCSSDVILKVEDLNVSYNMNLYNKRVDSFRDFFVGACKAPYNFFFKKRDRIKVLSGINFELFRGDRLGVLGVNGAGKTTLCRCIANVLNATSGEISVNGEVRSIFNSNTGVGAELTGRENAYILATLLYDKLSKSEIKELVAEAIEFSELGDFIDVPFKNYSKGMQTRLCLSIISGKPTDLLILDEVLDGADQFFRQKISERMKSIIHHSGAVILVTHSKEEITRICNRLMIIDNTKILFDGSIKKGLAVYDFLGDKNEN